MSQIVPLLYLEDSFVMVGLFCATLMSRFLVMILWLLVYIWLYPFHIQLLLLHPFPLVLSPFYPYVFYVWGDLSLDFHWDFIHIHIHVSEKVDVLLGNELGDTCAYEISCFWCFMMEIIVLSWVYWVIYGCWIWFSLVYHEMFVSVLFRVTCYPLLSSTFPNVSHLNPKPTLQPYANLFDLVWSVCSVLELDMSQSPWFAPIRCLIPDSSLVGRLWAKHEP